MSAEHGHTHLVFHFGMVGNEFLAGTGQIIHAFIRIGGTLTHKQYDALVFRQGTLATCLPAVGRAIDPSVYWVRYALDVLPLEQRAGLGLTCKPSAARHEKHRVMLQHVFLATPYLVGKVALRATAWQVFAIAATASLKPSASQGEMADARCGPDVVLAGSHYRTLSKETQATGVSGANEGNFVRCVRDLTPEEIAKLEQQKD